MAVAPIYVLVVRVWVKIARRTLKLMTVWISHLIWTYIMNISINFTSCQILWLNIFLEYTECRTYEKIFSAIYIKTLFIIVWCYKIVFKNKVETLGLGKCCILLNSCQYFTSLRTSLELCLSILFEIIVINFALYSWLKVI